jgi:ferredoxin
MTSRMVVDRIRCDGRGACAELLPEAISLDDWGYPVLAPGGIAEHLLPMARLAVSSCPVMALRLARSVTPDRKSAPTLTGVSQPQVTVL